MEILNQNTKKYSSIHNLIPIPLLSNFSFSLKYFSSSPANETICETSSLPAWELYGSCFFMFLSHVLVIAVGRSSCLWSDIQRHVSSRQLLMFFKIFLQWSCKWDNLWDFFPSCVGIVWVLFFVFLSHVLVIAVGRSSCSIGHPPHSGVHKKKGYHTNSNSYVDSTTKEDGTYYNQFK